VLGRDASEGDLDAAAQQIASAMESAVRAHPTHWFPFG
jgi:lauroyl/myristoyl acyltransferase